MNVTGGGIKHCNFTASDRSLVGYGVGRSSSSSGAPAVAGTHPADAHDPVPCRVGEAANPGPDDDNPCNAQYLTVATSNPSGFRGKEELLLGQGCGIFHLSETQLSHVTGPSSIKRLAALGRDQQRHIRTVHGAYAPLRANSLWAGSWTGVLISSDFPVQPIQLPWDDGVFETGRAVVAKHVVGKVPIVSASIYGFPPGPTFPGARDLTNRLLSTITREVVCGLSGVRIVSGDLNHPVEDLQQLQLWRRMGWAEAQDLAEFWWQQPQRPTCKGATKRDFIFLSPEAIALVRRVRVLDHFAEHATVMVDLDISLQPLTARCWHVPAAIPWDSVDLQAWHSSFIPQLDASGSSTDWYRSFGNTLERSLDHFVASEYAGQLPKRCRGRAKFTEPVKKFVTPPTLKVSRPGEEPIRSSLVSTAVRQWCRQLRRLQSMVHACNACNTSVEAESYKVLLWAAIRRAPGFWRSFAEWWPHRAVQLHGSPMFIPLGAPAAVSVQLIFEDFRANFRKFEAWNVRQRQQMLQIKFDHSPDAVFRYIKDDRPAPVDNLVLKRNYTVLGVDASANLVHLDSDIHTADSSQWALQGLPAIVQVETVDTAKVECDYLLCAGQVLEQEIFVTDLDRVQQELVSLWQPRWNTAVLSQEETTRISAFVRAFVPAGSLPFRPITVHDWTSALRRYRPRAAKGPDGVAIQDLRSLHPRLTQQLVGWLNLLEAGGTTWPDQLLEGVVISLAKTIRPMGPDEYRPVVVYSIIFRTWSAIRARAIFDHIAPLMQNHAYGFLPGRETLQYLFALQSLVEISTQSDVPVCGAAVDLQKCFNNLQRLPVFSVARALGIGDHILRPWQQFLDSNRRRFLVRGSLSEPVTATTGFAEGCSLSVAAMLIDFCYHTYMTAFAPGITSYSYVDNLAFSAATPSALARGW